MQSHVTISRKEQILFVICIALLLSFLAVTLLRSSFHNIDSQVNIWIPSVQTLPLTIFAEGIAFIFDTTSLVLISLVFSGLLFLKNRKPEGLLLLGAMAGDALIVSVIKTIDQVARPTNGILPDTGFSYPSGHSAGVVVFIGVLVFLAWRNWNSMRSKVLIGASMGLLVGIVGFDRLYLNVHWLSDVVGGWLFGTFWLSFALLVFSLLETAGKFKSRRFGLIANWLYIAALIVSILVIVIGLVSIG